MQVNKICFFETGKKFGLLYLVCKNCLCSVTAHLICAFVFAYAESRFSHDMAHVFVGIQTTTCYWPVKVTDLNKVVLFKLQFYDAGEAAIKKFDHILSVSSLLHIIIRSFLTNRLQQIIVDTDLSTSFVALH